MKPLSLVGAVAAAWLTLATPKSAGAMFFGDSAYPHDSYQSQLDHSRVFALHHRGEVVGYSVFTTKGDTLTGISNVLAPYAPGVTAEILAFQNGIANPNRIPTHHELRYFPSIFSCLHPPVPALCYDLTFSR